MEIYKSAFLQIHLEKDQDLFVMKWLKSPKTFSQFKTELVNYVNLYLKSEILHALWLHQEFCFQLTDEHFSWIEENVNKKCFSDDAQKTAFVVGNDALAHFGVMDSFEKTDFEVKNIRHFATESDARNWILDTEKEILKNEITKITFKGVDEQGNAILEIIRPASGLTNTLKEVKDILEESRFIADNVNKFTKLTKREKQIFAAYANGKKHGEIADSLNVSLHTVRTHWRNVKKKLAIISSNDIHKYAKSFKVEEQL